MRLTNKKVQVFKWVLNVVDVASRYKYSIPLTSKTSSEVAKAFRKSMTTQLFFLPGPSYYNVAVAESLWAKLPD